MASKMNKKIPASSSSSPKTPSQLSLHTTPPSLLTIPNSPDLQLLHDQVLKTPPHYNPLSKFTGNIKQGLKMGSDLAFLNLFKKFKEFDPHTFVSEVEIYEEQFTFFKEMGYDISKLTERFYLLKQKVEKEKLLRDAVEELEEQQTQKESKIEKRKLNLKELKSECKRIESQIELDILEVGEISSKKMKIMENSNSNMNEFRKLVKSSWE